MATYTLSAADSLLKDLYVGPIVELLNYKTYMLDQIERDVDSIDHTGRRAIFPVHSGRNRGRGSRGDNATLPVAGHQRDLDAVVKIRYHYGAIEITDPTIHASKSNAGAFANLLKRESTMVAKELKKDINRQVFGTGDGVLANVAKESEKAKVYVDSAQYIHVGDPIDIVVKADGKTEEGVVGTVVTNKVTAAESYIEIEDELKGKVGTTYSVYVHGSRNNEMDGLRNIIAKERKLHEIESKTAGNEVWDSSVLSASGNVAGESLFEQLDDEVAEAGTGEINTWLTTRGIKRRLANTYQSQKRYNDARAVNIHGGYSAIFVNEKPVVTDKDCPKGDAFGINNSAFAWFEQTSPGWLEKDGQVFHLKNAETAGQKMNVWQAWFRWYAALGCKEPNTLGRLEKCADDLPSDT